MRSKVICDLPLCTRLSVALMARQRSNVCPAQVSNANSPSGGRGLRSFRMNTLHRCLLHMVLAVAAVGFARAAAPSWSVADLPNPDQPGRQIDIRQVGELVARFIHGEGQMKPYLHVFGPGEVQLTKGDPGGRFQHHRGIYIGWNRIESDLGRDDLWHLNRGGRMSVTQIDRMEAGPGGATLVLTIEWRGGQADAAGNDLLLVETRTLTVSRSGTGPAQVDASFRMKAARPLRLDGDLQHAGIHFRAAQEVAEREKEPVYLTSPEGVVAGGTMHWCQFTFPIGGNWYSAVQMNAPANPVEELSMRAYGRFGYFFKRSLAKDEELAVNYRFRIVPAEAPAAPQALSPAQAAADRKRNDAWYRDFVGPR